MKNFELDYQLPPSSWFKRMLWACAGGDKFLLERATYSDQVKYMCLGGIVLATGLMASLAGGYAFYTIFAPKAPDVLNKINAAGAAHDIPTDPKTVLLSIIFGIVWGLIIFNIDRFIVAATGKGDGTEKITWSEFVGAIPRILMGTIIAITISKPVEIRMFKSEIDVELQNEQMIKEKEFRSKVDEEFNAEVARIQKDIDKFNTGIQDKIDRHKDLEKQYIDEARTITVGPRALAVKAQMEAVGKEIETAQADPAYQNLLAKRKDLEKDRAEKLKNSYKVAGGLDGLLERIKIAHHISGNVSIFITLLFLAIELTPVFFKLMLIKSPYDYMKDNLEDEIRAQHGIEVKYDYYKDKKGLERHLVINHDAANQMYEKEKLSDVQRELTDYAIQKYKEREKENIDKNLDEYIVKKAPHILPKSEENPTNPETGAENTAEDNTETEENLAGAAQNTSEQIEEEAAAETFSKDESFAEISADEVENLQADTDPDEENALAESSPDLPEEAFENPGSEHILAENNTKAEAKDHDEDDVSEPV